MTQTIANAKLVHCKPVPRYIRRLIHDTSQCHYQREEYRTSSERNVRYSALRGMAGLVRYSDMNAAGIMVYVVAWTRPHGASDCNGDRSSNGNEFNRNDDGVWAANRKATRGRVPYISEGKLSENPLDSTSIEMKQKCDWDENHNHGDRICKE